MSRLFERWYAVDVMPSSDQGQPATLSGPFRRGSWITVFMVAIALTVTILEAHFTWALVIQSGLVAAVYLAASLKWGDRLEPAGPWLSRSLYFLFQFAVMALMAVVLTRHRVFGATWLFYMPLVAQSRMVLRAVGTAIVCLGSLALMTLHVATFAGWQEVPSSLFAVTTAVVFVLIFTDIAMREAAARADSQRLSEELEKANQQLSHYAVQAEELAAARERARMAREIHDSVGHSLTAVNMQIEAARSMLDRDLTKARSALDKAQTCIRDGLSEIRHSVGALRSDPLNGRELHGALVELADLATAAGLPVSFRVRGQQRPLSEAVTLTLFRCAQEGLTNVKKHAHAKNVEVLLDYRVEGENEPRVALQIADDGVGSARPTGGFGLLGVRERVRQLDGRIDIVSSPGQGLSLDIELPAPLPGQEAAS